MLRIDGEGLLSLEPVLHPPTQGPRGAAIERMPMSLPVLDWRRPSPWWAQLPLCGTRLD